MYLDNGINILNGYWSFDFCNNLDSIFKNFFIFIANILSGAHSHISLHLYGQCTYFYVGVTVLCETVTNTLDIRRRTLYMK